MGIRDENILRVVDSPFFQNLELQLTFESHFHTFLPHHLHHHPDNANSTHGIDHYIQPAELSLLFRDFLYQFQILFITGFEKGKNTVFYLPYPIVTIGQNFLTVIF